METTKEKAQEKLSFTEEKDQDLLYNTRSEEVQEIMGRMPSWIIRWGISSIALLILFLFIGAAWISYPEAIVVPVKIVPENPPEKILASVDARIERVLVSDADWVNKGQILALIDTGVDQEHLAKALLYAEKLEQALVANGEMPELPTAGLKLGDLSDAFSDLIFFSGEYGRVKSEAAVQVLQLRQQLHQTRNNFIHQQRNWEKRNIIRAGADGQIRFQKKLRNGINISSGELLMLLTDTGKSSVLVTAFLDIADADRVKEGQKAIIKLDGFPHEEYGFIECSVSSRSPVATEPGYTLDLKLKQGMLSSRQKEIPGQLMLNGTAEIIIGEKSVLHRIFEKLLRFV